MSCCDDFGNCRQGRDCPVRAANSFPHVTGCSQKAPIAHSQQAPAAIETVASDRKGKLLHMAEWLALTAAMVFALAASAGFFNFGA